MGREDKKDRKAGDYMGAGKMRKAGKAGDYMGAGKIGKAGKAGDYMGAGKIGKAGDYMGAGKAGKVGKAGKRAAAALSPSLRLEWKPGNMLYPVPAVMVSCGRAGETPNIITVAWAGTVCSDPAMLSIAVRPERYSYGIIKESGEFVVNLVNEELLRAMDYCGVKSGREVDKFKEMGLTPLKSRKIGAPGIAQSPVSIECKVTQSIPLGSHELFLAEVKCVTVDGAYMDKKGKFDLSRAGLVAYSHGEYFALGKKLGAFGYSVVKPWKAPEKRMKDTLRRHAKPVKQQSPGIRADEKK